MATPRDPAARSLGAPEVDVRRDLQARLLVFTRLMFASFVMLIAFLYAVYRLYPEIRPANEDVIVDGELVALAAMAIVWRGVLARRDVSLRALYRIDLIYAVGIGIAFGSSALLAPDLRPAAWTSLIFACFTVFTRALLVPSTGRRTAVVSALAFVPLIGAAIGLVARTTEELPAPAFVGGAVLIAAIVVLISSTGSRIIYGLRRQVSDAMQLGMYKLDRLVGRGGMGEVYRAHHALLRRETAVKLMRPDRPGVDVDRFEREVHAMSRLTHPNTVAVYDYGRSPAGEFYYAMEYLGGGLDLEHLVAQHGPLPPARVVDILVQVCGALHEAHSMGIVHRDIKPANIILCERGGVPDVAKVVDFGLAKELMQTTGDTHQIILGTPEYLAPEAATGTVGTAADLYALGAVGYFLLTGHRVFEGHAGIDLIVKHVTVAPTPPSTWTPVPPELEALVLQCLAKAPADRPASAKALAAALRALPPTPGWDEAMAARWWREVHTAPRAADSSPALAAITVDLAHRQ